MWMRMIGATSSEFPLSSPPMGARVKHAKVSEKFRSRFPLRSFFVSANLCRRKLPRIRAFEPVPIPTDRVLHAFVEMPCRRPVEFLVRLVAIQVKELRFMQCGGIFLAHDRFASAPDFQCLPDKFADCAIGFFYGAEVPRAAK